MAIVPACPAGRPGSYYCLSLISNWYYVKKPDARIAARCRVHRNIVADYGSSFYNFSVEIAVHKFIFIITADGNFFAIEIDGEGVAGNDMTDIYNE
jgi:hypothetical protein